ncbi:MAG: DsrE family protein, partial [Planctomycetota bacterium]
CDSCAMQTVVVLNQDQMGHGDRALGQKILGTFLKKSIALRGFDAIVLFNAGVKLVAADSPVLAELKLLEERGVDLIPCGTCLQHFGVTPAVGKVGDMDAIVRELDRAAKVITL